MDAHFKSIIKRILKISPTTPTTIAEVLADSFFVKYRKALVFKGPNCWIFQDENNYGTVDVSLLQIIDFINKLHANGLIILVPNDKIEDSEEVAYYTRCIVLRRTQNPNRYKIENNCEINLNETPILTDGNKKLYGQKINECFTTQITKFLPYIVCPTEELNKYKMRGYKTDNEFALKQSVRANTIAWIVLLVSIILNFISLYIQHNYIQTTICQEQYHRLIESINSSKNN